MLRFVPSLPNTNQLSSDDMMRLKFVINGPMNDFWKLKWMQLPITRLAYSFIRRQICTTMFQWQCMCLMIFKHLSFQFSFIFTAKCCDTWIFAWIILSLFINDLDLPWLFVFVQSNNEIKFELSIYVNWNGIRQAGRYKRDSVQLQPEIAATMWKHWNNFI